MREIEAAAAAIRRGELVAMPTETVYGLAADATNSDAVARVYALKGRPATNPLIVHIESTARLTRIAKSVPEDAWSLIAAFWPGPLTLVLPRHPDLPPSVTAGGETVAVRMPNHPVALALIAESDRPLAAPSANLSERLSPTSAADLAPEIVRGVSMILDGGPCRVGIESTVLDLSSSAPAILRPGSIGSDEIERVLGRSLAEARFGGAARSPGLSCRHYSPRARLIIVSSGDADLAIGDATPEEYTRTLYARLAAYDRESRDQITVEAPPEETAWTAVWDRLRRMVG